MADERFAVRISYPHEITNPSHPDYDHLMPKSDDKRVRLDISTETKLPDEFFLELEQIIIKHLKQK